MPQKETIVIVGTGWAGYTLSQSLDMRKYDIKIISPQATFPYTPLLASAACGMFDLSLAQEPVRKKGKQIHFIKAKVEDVDFSSKKCQCRADCDIEGVSAAQETTFSVPYDRLVLAPGCITNTFNTPGAKEYAYFLRNVPDARIVQHRVKEALDLACIPGISDEQQRALLHIIIIGGGPTGVEVAAEMSDLFHGTFAGIYPGVAQKFRISIHDAAPEILSPFEEELKKHSIQSFRKRGVEIITDSKIKNVESDSITTEAEGKIPCGIVIWTAGNKQNPLVDTLDLAKTDKLPRLLTNEYLHALDSSKQPLPDVYALGDAADIEEQFLPTTAEVAVQKAEYLAEKLNRFQDPLESKQPFKYKQQPLVAYIGGHDGVVAGDQNWTGPRAWAAWRSKNLFWVRSWRRRVMIVLSWALDWAGGREITRQ